LEKLYKNLDIITNKATEEEIKGVKHHLLGYLEATCISNYIVEYKHKAVDLVKMNLSFNFES
jgi:tRNA A37 N6-isopentenylltransferase MiaA